MSRVIQVIKEIDLAAAKRKAFLSELNGLKDSEHSTKTTFKAFSKGRKATGISELLDENGQLVNDWEGIVETTMTFLKALFTSVLVVDQDRMDKILRNVRK